ncbi:hypothetical protein [Chitinophaga arvensicola]|uniref:YD repeat-containing protein n=1 Tax=Chitinophaga arvensicola TaxID=29529 RepID=A0A1I0SD14_9BACT|nr:hypothetical protein [Chitinophaga arvensicola]SEW55560.1 hypothetical protein SAMN04488122_6417 [Chitinophaga arvensicola]
MKKNTVALLCASLIIAVSSFTGCLTPAGHVIIPDPKYYQIEQLISRSYFNFDTGKVTYNKKGDPVSILYPNARTGFPNFLFRYNKLGQITDIIGAYQNGYFETWQHFVYDQYHVLRTDSVYDFGLIGDNGPLPIVNRPLHIIRTTAYTFDARSRVTKTVRNDFYSPLYTTLYYYNAAGNAYKISSYSGEDSPFDDFPVYDNKVNPHNLHPVWQLMDLDYSCNNPFVADNYNAYGLPTRITASFKFSTGFLHIHADTINIKYKH